MEVLPPILKSSINSLGDLPKSVKQTKKEENFVVMKLPNVCFM